MSRPRRWSAGGVLARAAAASLLLFLTLPVVWLAWSAWTRGVSGLLSPLVMPALKLSLLTSAASLAVVLVLGTPLAWQLARARGRWAGALEAVVQLPVVLPPAVAGLALLLALGRKGPLSPLLTAWGLAIPFTPAAVVMAGVFVSAPFYLQSALASFRRMDEDLLWVARSLGASPSRAFFRVALPLCAPGLAGGAAIAWARALGEFGATLMFAGNLPGRTQTLPLAIYAALEVDPRAAQAVALLLVAMALGVLLLWRWLVSRAEEWPGPTGTPPRVQVPAK